MKKSLIALAVLASTGAMAQSSVTMYGVIDASLQTAKSTGSVRQNSMEDGNISGSRFGLKGSEDLGGGLKAIFVLESGLKIDTGASGKAGSVFNRQSYVGLTGNFGELTLGNRSTAYDDISIVTNPVFDGAMSPANVVWTNNYNSRPGNNLYYATPSFGGVTAAVSYSLGENKAPGLKAVGVTAFNIAYANGPVYASLGYQIDKNAVRALGAANTALAAATPATVIALTAAQGTAADASRKSTLLNASYDLGVAKLLASYNRNETATLVKADQYQFGVDVPVGAALTVSGGYAYSKDKDVAGVTGEKRSGFGIGAKYALSKRTFVYTDAVYGEAKNPGVAKDKTDKYAIGIQHAF